jgi:hypothetical protein
MPFHLHLRNNSLSIFDGSFFSLGGRSTALAETYVQKVQRWASEAHEWDSTEGQSVDYFQISDQIEYFAKHLFNDYQPTKGLGEKHFLDRFNDWLNSVSSDDDQRILFQLVCKIFFIGRNEFESLYQAAFNGPVARWLIDQEGMKLDSTNTSRLKAAERQTWFCAITDSMQISDFYHLNHIQGVEIRPVWRTLYEFANETSARHIDEYMKKRGFKRLVLLEDFVGSGTQMETAVRFAASLPSHYPLLLCPIVICPKGISKGEELDDEFGHLTFSPVLQLQQEIFLARKCVDGESEFMASLRQVVTNNHKLLVNPKTKYSPFGFRSTGSLVVMHTNCPNNTLPILHHSSNGGSPWSALFPRSERV